MIKEITQFELMFKEAQLNLVVEDLKWYLAKELSQAIQDIDVEKAIFLHDQLKDLETL